MKNGLKNGLCLLLSLTAAVSLCGCAPREDNDGTPRGGGHEALTMYTFNANYQEFTDALHEKYPEINIEFIQYEGYNMTGLIREEFETGILPDIINTTYIQPDELQKANLLDLSSYEFVNQYSDNMLNISNVDGGIYMLPSNYKVIGIYYNKTVMEKYGWELPETFDELLELTPKIRAEGLKPVAAVMTLPGYSFHDFFGLGNTFYFNTLEGARWKEDFLTGKANAVGNIEPVLEYFQKWIDAGLIDPSDMYNSDTEMQFQKGEAVFELSLGISPSLDFDDVGHMEYGIMPWLPDEGGEPMLINNISRYYALNKRLGDPGNEQKLKDALHFMEFLSTAEGQSLINPAKDVVSPLETSQISEESMAYAVKDVITAGNTMPLVYVGWDDLIIPMAESLYDMIEGKKNVEETARAFDEARDKLLEEGVESYGNVPEYIGLEDTARLVGISLVKGTEADAALVSLMKFNGFDNEVNRSGIGCGIYPGELIFDRLRTFVPARKYCVAEMTGAEIKGLAETGCGAYGQGIYYDYVMAAENDMELEDGKTYKVILAQSEIGEDKAETISAEYTPVDMQEMIRTYIKNMGGTITVDNITWQRE